jgi:hypothetical protein
MTALRATFYFSVGELLVQPELLGTSHSVERESRLYVLGFPASDERRLPDDEPGDAELRAKFPAREEPPLPAGTGDAYVSISLAPSESLAHVPTMRADVAFDGSIGLADFAHVEQPKESPGFDDALALLEDAELRTTDVVEDLLAWCRAAGRQPWLGLGGQRPKVLGRGQLYDLDAGYRLPVTTDGDAIVLHRVGEDQVLSSEQLGEFASKVAADEDPPLPEVLRMDANYFLQHAEPADPRRAILMAAIACEVRIKSELRQRSSHKPVESLILQVLNRPPVAGLFDAPMKALTGISLREDEPVLFETIERLFQRRNRLAHQGTLVKQGEPAEDVQATEAVAAVRDVGRWLTAKLPSIRRLEPSGA